MALLLVLILYFNAPPAYASLNGAYPYPYRPNPAQIEAAEWLRLHTKPESNIATDGVIIDKTVRWIRTIAQRNVYESYKREKWSVHYGNLTNNYYFVDYNDLILTRNEEGIGQLQAYEAAKFQNQTPLYNKNNIRIYRAK